MGSPEIRHVWDNFDLNCGSQEIPIVRPLIGGCVAAGRSSRQWLTREVKAEFHKPLRVFEYTDYYAFLDVIN